LAEILRFAAKISTQGDMRLLIIPKELHKEIKKHVGKQVKITIEDL